MTTESIAVRNGGGTVQQSNGGGEINFPAMMAQADVLINSGFLPQAIKTPAQAVAIMLTGRELGIPTMQALRQINVIQGKPTMAAELMLALAYQRIPGFRYAVVKSTAQECVCQFERPGHKPYQHTFTLADAAALGLSGKQNWHTQPATMLRWRCISSGLRLVAPDAIAGVYTPEELMPDAKVNFETGVVERIPEQLPASVATPVPSMPPPAPANVDVKTNTPPPKGEPVISLPQQKRLFAIADKGGVTADTLHDHLLKKYGIEHSKDIERRSYDAICAWAQSGGQNPPADPDPDEGRKDGDPF